MSGFLVDTNVLSELRKPAGDPRVIDWFSAQADTDIHTSIFVMSELRWGANQVADATRRALLNAWIDSVLPPFFGPRIHRVDADTADLWAVLNNDGRRRGRPFAQPDLLIAATALRHGLTVVTRNTRDFEATGVTLFNPWES